MENINIFDYAKQELSLDAFLIWLLRHYNCEGGEAYEIAKELLKKIVNRERLPSGKIEVKKQEGHRDITIYFPNKKCIIFFENKIDSNIGYRKKKDNNKDLNEEDNQESQIERYYIDLKGKYKSFEIIPVFFKLGYSPEKELRKLGKKLNEINQKVDGKLIIFNQKQISEFFKKYTLCKGIILKSWVNYFNKLDMENCKIDSNKQIKEIIKEYSKENYNRGYLLEKILDKIRGGLDKGIISKNPLDWSVGSFRKGENRYLWTESFKLREFDCEFGIRFGDKKISFILYHKPKEKGGERDVEGLRKFLKEKIIRNANWEEIKTKNACAKLKFNKEEMDTYSIEELSKEIYTKINELFKILEKR
jgi:hypothetical protein